MFIIPVVLSLVFFFVVVVVVIFLELEATEG